ncbi:MAG: 2,3-dihydroxybenzoate-AMP ligase [Oceanicoccus sp.]|jgi:2,3-dihydroxybenzoate-AMP ligase
MSQAKPNGFTPWPEDEVTEYLENEIWINQPIYFVIQLHANLRPNQCALIAGDQQLTYAQLWQDIVDLSKGMLLLGLKQGDNCVLHLGNIIEFYICYFALLRIGVKPVMALPAHRLSELNYFVEFTQARCVITSDQNGWSCQTLLQQLKQNLNCLQIPLVVENQHGDDFSSIEKIKALGRSNRNPLPTQEHILSQDIAFFQLSGGTTGVPKLIPRTHNDYVYSVRMSNEVCEFNADTRYLCALPAAHNFPLSSPGALGTFLAGGCVVLATDPSPQTISYLIEKHRITVTAMVPPLVMMCLDFVAGHTVDFTSLKYIQVGGARLSEQVARRVEPELGCKLMQVFGMAEGLVNYTRLDDDLDEIIHSQGRPMSPLDQLKIVDEHGQDVPKGEAGILLTKGPYTIRGYFNAPDHNARSFNDEGYYITGDIVRLTPAGNLQVIGRDKDQINRGGEKIAAEEIENHLLAHELINNVALIGISDPVFGEKTCAVVQCHGAPPKVFELKRFLRQRQLADYKIPDRIEFVSQLPKTPVGKIDKKELKKQYQLQGA